MMKNILENMSKIIVAVVFTLSITLFASIGSAHENGAMNPCKKANPCAKKMDGKNPCDMEKMNPCDMKKMQKEMEKKNPCANKAEPKNPCAKKNPCDN